MKIFFVSPYPIEGPSSRLRIYQYVPFLEASGHEVTISPFLDAEGYQLVYQPGRFLPKALAVLAGSWKRLRLLAETPSYDLCIIHREAAPAGPGLFEWLFAKRSRRLLYDFDDAVFEPNVSTANRLFGFLKSTRKIPRLISRCDAVIAGNDYLETYAKQFCSNTFQLPTPIDTRRFVPRDRKPGQPVVIGWIGSHTTAPYLELTVEALQRLKDELDEQVRVEIIGAGDYRLKGHLADHKPWVLETEVEDVQRFDIGVMPMPDDRWTRGKCGFKALQYMSVGIPVVCSPVGVNREIVIPGENGLWAETPSEWYEALRRLVEDPGLRRKMGETGRRTVEEKYSLERCARRLEEIFSQVAQEAANNASSIN